MAINPLQLLKIKEKLNAFKTRHPGFARFIRAVRKNGIPEGSVVDVKITFPDGKEINSNFRVSGEDMELASIISELKK